MILITTPGKGPPARFRRDHPDLPTTAALGLRIVRRSISPRLTLSGSRRLASSWHVPPRARGVGDGLRRISSVARTRSRWRTMRALPQILRRISCDADVSVLIIGDPSGWRSSRTR